MLSMLKLKYAEHGLQNLPKRVDSIVVWRSYKQKQPLKKYNHYKGWHFKGGGTFRTRSTNVSSCKPSFNIKNAT